jgi:hypothetical protein
MQSNEIPKIMGHVWIGPLSPPTEWMNTWRDLHPNWDYRVYDNDFLRTEDFETQSQINEYMRRGNYAGVADMMRYEILFRYGGFFAEADSICHKKIDNLLDSEYSIFTCYENEHVTEGLVTPIMASVPGHPFLRLLIDGIKSVSPSRLDTPWKQTGNLYVAKMIEKHNPDIKIWPSHYFIPKHHTGLEYEGKDEIYAEQFFGTTNKIYKTPTRAARLLEHQRKLYKRLRKKMKRFL